MFREGGFNRRYRVVYFTELDEDERDVEIAAAFEGEHFYDGFIAAADSQAAKEALSGFLARLNDGRGGTSEDLEALLARFLRP